MNRPFTREPYPSWYRKLPVSVYMPWRNLGCLGVRVFGVYVDMFRTWHWPWFGMFIGTRHFRVYPIASLKQWCRRMRQKTSRKVNSIRDHAESHLYDYQFMDKPIYWWSRFWVYTTVIAIHIRYGVGSMICKRFGHSHNVEVEDFVAGERDHRGRLTDIDGGGVEWYCPRCGQGGRSWF